MTSPICPDRRQTRILTPASAVEASALAKRYGAPYMAGASALQLGWNKSAHWPEYVISLHAIKTLHGCHRAADHWSLGALTRLSELARNSALCAELPVLETALLGVGAPGIRHLATLAGNIGFAGDLLPTLLVLDARLDWLDEDGTDQQSLLANWLTASPPHALITRVRLPLPAKTQHLRMEKLASRGAFNPPLLNIASSWQWQPRPDVRLAAGGAGLRPRRLRGCEQALAATAAQPLAASALLPLVAADLPELAEQPLLQVAANLIQAQWRGSHA